MEVNNLITRSNFSSFIPALTAISLNPVPSSSVDTIFAMPDLTSTFKTLISVNYNQLTKFSSLYTSWTCQVAERNGPATRTLSAFAAPRIVREALSASTLTNAGGSGDVGSNDGS